MSFSVYFEKNKTLDFNFFETNHWSCIENRKEFKKFT